MKYKTFHIRCFRFYPRYLQNRGGISNKDALTELTTYRKRSQNNPKRWILPRRPGKYMIDPIVCSNDHNHINFVKFLLLRRNTLQIMIFMSSEGHQIFQSIIKKESLEYSAYSDHIQQIECYRNVVTKSYRSPKCEMMDNSGHGPIGTLFFYVTCNQHAHSWIDL